jgi:DNA-binding winged helix-turn-helix (wHTH) protein
VPAPRFRFQEFLLSPAHRTLRRGDRDLPLIRRYFDLLVLLVVERHRVVTRPSSTASGGCGRFRRCLSQAIRTIRRALDDDSREPDASAVSRHGYQFVAAEVLESDDGPLPPPPSCLRLDRPRSRPRWREWWNGAVGPVRETARAVARTPALMTPA